MKFLLKRWDHLVLLIGWLALAVSMTGCGSFGGDSANHASTTTTDIPVEPVGPLRVEDQVSVIFSGVANAPDKYDGRVKEDGTISLSLIGDIQAKGLTPGQLEKAIRDAYLSKKYYKETLNVTVNSESRFYSVSGEVRNPSRQVHSGKITFVSAIASASGFTDFARKTKVQIIRSNGAIEYVNYEKALKDPSKDVQIYPGDRIIVIRRRL